jgi:hypothetical protein
MNYYLSLLKILEKHWIPDQARNDKLYVVI